MSTYNKNVSNQSGLSIDNISVKNTVYLPSGATITSNSDSVLTSGDQSISGNKTFTDTILSNNGYTLPTVYSLSQNALGYTINGTALNSQPFISLTTNTTISVYSVTLPYGVWLVSGQFEYYSNISTSLSYSEIMTTLTINNLNTFINYNKSIVSGSIIQNEYIINQVTGVYNNTSSSLQIVLSGKMKFSAGQLIFKYIPASATTTTSTTNLYTFTLNFNNEIINIIIGMIVSSPTNGIITGSPVVTNVTGTTITVNTQQSIPANSTLYFTFTYPRSYLKAVRIG